jgi:nicotinamide-nucleotide amidase
MLPPIVELLVIGNEVLAGDVLDTNSHWLCRQLAARGARVKRTTVLPDEPTAIGDELRAALSRRPALILTCGGLGPTVDDLTLAAIGATLGRPVREDPVAYAMIRDFYALLFTRGDVTTAEMTPARVKMARLPLDSEPLLNTVGAAPGVLLQEGETLIASLPGVPAEMKAIFEQVLWPRLATRFTGEVYAERTLQTDCWDESIMAPAVDAVTARHPQVYVKSRAQVYGSGIADFVTLAARGENEEQTTALLDAAEDDLRQALVEVGIKVTSNQE